MYDNNYYGGDYDYGYNDDNDYAYDPLDDDKDAFEELNDSKGLDLWNNIITCRGKLSRIIFDKQFTEQEIIIFIETILNNIQRFCKTNNSMRTDENSQPMSPGRSIGFLYRDITPNLKGPKTSLKRMHKLLLETATLVMKAEANVRNYAINNPHSLRNLSYLKEITPSPVTAGASTFPITGPEVVYGQAQTKERLDRVEGVIQSKIAKLVESLKGLEIKMKGGYGPGKDVKLPEEWVDEYLDSDEGSVDEEEKEEGLRFEETTYEEEDDEDKDGMSEEEDDYWNAG
jgi:hypothetical protein